MAAIDDAEAQTDMALNLDEQPDMHNMVDAALNDDALIQADAAQHKAHASAEDPTLAVGPSDARHVVPVQAIN